MFLVLWEFEVKPGCEGRFESVYGPSGDWVRLFRTDPAYLETRLVRDPFHPSRYITLDFWKSREAYERFKQQNAQAYRAIDTLCEDLTTQERHLGAFVEAR